MIAIRRVGGRVVECSGLENQRARKRSGGSNPSPPAIKKATRLGGLFNAVEVGDKTIRPARPGFENKLNEYSKEKWVPVFGSGMRISGVAKRI